MQEIKFDRNEYDNESELLAQSSDFSKQRHGALIGILLKLGITNGATINFILLAVAAIFFVTTIYIYAGILGNNAPVKQTTEQIAKQQKIMREAMGIK